jgi:hypothetical protein
MADTRSSITEAGCSRLTDSDRLEKVRNLVFAARAWMLDTQRRKVDSEDRLTEVRELIFPARYLMLNS